MPKGAPAELGHEFWVLWHCIFLTCPSKCSDVELWHWGPAQDDSCPLCILPDTQIELKMGQVAACPWSQGLAGAQGEAGLQQEGSRGLTPSYPRQWQKLGETDPSRRGNGKLVTPGGGGGGGRGAKPSLGLCVCVCRRRRLLPEDALDKGLVCQSPSQGLGWDQEQRER